jgi:hypothetical protein
MELEALLHRVHHLVQVHHHLHLHHLLHQLERRVAQERAKVQANAQLTCSVALIIICVWIPRLVEHGALIVINARAIHHHRHHHHPLLDLQRHLPTAALI